MLVASWTRIHRIRRIDPGGVIGSSCVRAIAGDGTLRTITGICGQRGFFGDGGPATEALLDQAFGIELGQDGKLYIADTNNHVIRVVGLSSRERA